MRELPGRPDPWWAGDAEWTGPVRGPVTGRVVRMTRRRAAAHPGESGAG